MEQALSSVWRQISVGGKPMGHTTTTYPSDHEYVTMSANTIRPQGLCRRDQPGLDAEEIYRVSSPTWFSVSVDWSADGGERGRSRRKWFRSIPDEMLCVLSRPF